MIRKRLLVVIAAAAAAGLGVALGVALAGPSSTTTRTVTVARAESSPLRTVTQIRTIERVRTRVRTVRVPSPAAPIAGVPANGAGQPLPARGRLTRQQFSGTGRRVLGTITVRQPAAMLRWTNSTGRFRLLFNGGSVGVDSTAHAGETGAPPLTYQQVTVDSPGHWTIQIG